MLAYHQRILNYLFRGQECKNSRYKPLYTFAFLTVNMNRWYAQAEMCLPLVHGKNDMP